MSNLLFVQKVFRHYRRDFYNGLLTSKEFSIRCYGEKNEIDELKTVFKKHNFTGYACFNIFSVSLLIEIFKCRIIVFPADLQYPKFIILGYFAKLFGKDIYYLGHYKGKRNNYIIKLLRRVYYSWPFKMLIYYKSELDGEEKKRVYHLDNTVNTNTIDKFLKQIEHVDMQKRGLNVAFIGRETEKSNYNLFISVSKSLVDKNIKFKSIGPIKKGFPSIEEYGAVFDERQLARILKDVDLVFYAGDVGLSLIHSFYYAIPALIHDKMNLHYPEVTNFEEGRNGLCYEHNSIESAVNVLLHLHSNRELLVKMSLYLKNSRAKYSVNKMIRNFKLAVDNANNTSN